jgi:hypothetical protein
MMKASEKNGIESMTQGVGVFAFVMIRSRRVWKTLVYISGDWGRRRMMKASEKNLDRSYEIGGSTSSVCYDPLPSYLDNTSLR